MKCIHLLMALCFSSYSCKLHWKRVKRWIGHARKTKAVTNSELLRFRPDTWSKRSFGISWAQCHPHLSHSRHQGMKRCHWLWCGRWIPLESFVTLNRVTMRITAGRSQTHYRTSTDPAGLYNAVRLREQILSLFMTWRKHELDSLWL